MIKMKQIFKKNFCSKVVRIEFNKLIDDTANTNKEIDEAFNKEGLGAIVVTKVPNLKQIRQGVFENCKGLVFSDHSKLQDHVKPEIAYLAGFEPPGIVNNDIPCAAWDGRSCAETIRYPQDPELEKRFENSWPPHLPQFKEKYQACGQLQVKAQLALLKCFDRYIGKGFEYTKEGTESMFNKFKDNFNDQQRMLMYYPIKEVKSNDTWGIKFHRDFCLVTCLIKPGFFTADKLEEVKTSYTALVLSNRKDERVEVEYEEDELVLQSGDMSFIYSNGNIMATPHGVITCADKTPKNCFRFTFANFFNPSYDFSLVPPFNHDLEEILKKDIFRDKYKWSMFEKGTIFADITIAAHKNLYGMSNEKI